MFTFFLSNNARKSIISSNLDDKDMIFEQEEGDHHVLLEPYRAGLVEFPSPGPVLEIVLERWFIPDSSFVDAFRVGVLIYLAFSSLFTNGR